MVVAAFAVAFVALGLVVFLVVMAARERDAHAKQLARMALEWAEERSELLERIARPDQVPPRLRAPRRGPGTENRDKPKDIAALAKVGTFAPTPEGERGSEGD